ncbi:MAG: DNA polymerase elongation subunit (Family B) [Clostridium sp.]
MPIVNLALKEYFIKGVPVEETINNCKDLMMFQKVVKISYKYSHALYGNKKLSEKCLRVFASKKEDDKGVYKVKENGRVEKIAGTPEKCFIKNDNVIGKRIPRRLDREWYIQVTRKRLLDFLGEENMGVL